MPEFFGNKQLRKIHQKNDLQDIFSQHKFPTSLLEYDDDTHRVLPRSKEYQSTERRTDTKEKYCSEEVLLGVYFFQVSACECGVAWCSVTNQEHSLFHAVVRLCHRIAGTVCRSVANH